MSKGNWITKFEFTCVRDTNKWRMSMDMIRITINCEHVECKLNCFNEEGLHLRSVLGCPGTFPVANRGMLAMARAPLVLEGC
eukprot:5036315-Pyramimonas_sp.AAC.1